jgi:hypothetical protein
MGGFIERDIFDFSGRNDWSVETKVDWQIGPARIYY